MKKKKTSINTGCNKIVEEFLQKTTPKSQWMALEEMVADLEKFERSSVKSKNPYTPDQCNLIKSVVNNALEKKTKLKNANLVRSTKNNKESILLLSTRVQILLAIMKSSPCHIAKEIDNETTIIKKAIDRSIKEYADVYEINITGEAKEVGADTDVTGSLKLLITVFRRAIDNLLFSQTLSLETNEDDVMELKTIDEVLVEGVKTMTLNLFFTKGYPDIPKALLRECNKTFSIREKKLKTLRDLNLS